MYWLARPAYHRWLAAAAVLLVATAIDLAGRATSPYPFTAKAVRAGEPLTGAIEWRDVPDGMLGVAGRVDGFAARSLTAGEPLTAGAVDSERGVRPGWWSVPVDLPAAAHRGQKVRIVSMDPPADAEGVVVEASGVGSFGAATPGLVGIPPDRVDEVAVASASGTLVVLLGD